MTDILVPEYKVPIKRLGAEFASYRVVQLTDLHLGRRFSPDQVLEKVKSLSADLIVLTGDLVHKPKFLSLARDFLALLKQSVQPTDGFISVLGNHDEVFRPFVGDNGPVRWLVNSSVQITRGRSRLNIVGLDQSRWFMMDICQALAGIHVDWPTIVLGHFPATAALVANIADLVITGHTHAGQIKLPGLPYATNDYLGWRYGHGIRQVGKGYLVVCSGLGYSGPVDFRLFSRPEIAVIELAPG